MGDALCKLMLVCKAMCACKAEQQGWGRDATPHPVLLTAQPTEPHETTRPVVNYLSDNKSDTSGVFNF